MNPTSIRILKGIKDGTNEKNALLNSSKIKSWQFNFLTKELLDKEYIEKRDSSYYLKNNPKSILFRDIDKKYDIVKLLQDSNEIIFSELINPLTITNLQNITNLSRATIYRSLKDLESIGAVIRENDIVRLHATNENTLYLFAQILNVERKRDDIKKENFAEVLYQDNSVILKRIPKWKNADGELTAFSLYSDYGIEYHTTHDYYIEQDSELKIEDILIHSVLISTQNEDKNGLIMSIIFYIINKSKVDILDIKKIARKFNIINIWIDIENFLRHNPITSNKLFPRWSEFKEKAELYGISQVQYELPGAYPELFERISEEIKDDTELYIIGGENMRIKGLKQSTKDCDIVVEKYALESVMNAIKKIGYSSKNEKDLSKDDTRVKPFIKFTHPNSRDIEIFCDDIARKFYLSERMKKRAKENKTFIQNDKLKLYLLSNEDIFLLKAVTDREGDLYDMTKLVQSGNFDWDIVWTELTEQEKDTGKYFNNVFLDSIDDLIKQTKIKPPFYKKLLHKAIEERICKILAKGKGMYTDDLTAIMKDNGVPEQTTRNRINSLFMQGIIKKYPFSNNRIYLKPTKTTSMKFQNGKEYLKESHYVNYNLVLKYLKDVSKYMSLSSSLYNSAIEIAEKVCSTASFIGNRPRNLAAAILKIATELNGYKHTRKDISNVMGVSEPSITILSKKIIRTLSLDNEQQIVINDNE